MDRKSELETGTKYGTYRRMWTLKDCTEKLNDGVQTKMILKKNKLTKEEMTVKWLQREQEKEKFAEQIAGPSDNQLEDSDDVGVTSSLHVAVDQDESSSSDYISDDEDTQNLVISVDKTPGIIDRSAIKEAYLQQLPPQLKQEMEEKGINYHKIVALRLEFYDILTINNLVMCPNLTVLSLSNNVIEKIQGLESLVNLRELDLSFNRIEKIRGLEVLTLFRNAIKTIERLDSQKKSLRVFSIGCNEIDNFDSVLYLRGFTNLSCLSILPNPVAEDDPGFESKVAALLPNLVYYNYLMVSDESRQKGKEILKDELKRIEAIEKKEQKLKESKKVAEAKEELLKNSFIEEFEGKTLYRDMMSKDREGQLFIQTSEAIKGVFTKLEEAVTSLSKQIFDLGIKYYCTRKRELNVFDEEWEKNSSQKDLEKRIVLRNFMFEKNKLVDQLRESYTEEVPNEQMAAKQMKTVLLVDRDFTILRRRTWWDLIEKEMEFFEGNQDILSKFENRVRNIVFAFLEKLQEFFTLMRDAENEFYEGLNDQLNNFMAGVYGKEEHKHLPDELTKILINKELLNNSIGSSHESHLLTIDTAEEKIITKLKKWESNLSEKLSDQEIQRNRSAILIVNRFLSMQKRQWESYTEEHVQKAYYFMLSIEPDWTHNVVRLKMNTKERMLDDQMQNLIRERLEQAVHRRYDMRKRQMEAFQWHTGEEEQPNLSDVEPTQMKRPLKKITRTQMEQYEKLMEGIETLEEEMLKAANERRLDAAIEAEGRKKFETKRYHKLRREEDEEDEEELKALKRQSVNRIAMKFSNACLMKRDTQIEAIYALWSSTEDLDEK